MKTVFTYPLDDPQAKLETVGGKGESLARLLRAGFPVPAGFHVTTPAYHRFVNDNDLQPRIREALFGLEASDTVALERASQVIAGAFLQFPIPNEIADAVAQAYAALAENAPQVAVRSSATAEDLPEASFAGQQESFLNIRGIEAVLAAIRECWASLWTARAISYRIRQGIPVEGIGLAVVVQALVPAQVSGILFTANPLNGRQDQVVINASWGLGESVVSGQVTPDTLTVDKSSGDVIQRETGEKLIQTVQEQNGTRQVDVPIDRRSAPVLDDVQAARLMRIGKQIETLYDMPMDIEWAMANGEFSILQARPITTLAAPEAPLPTEWKLPKGAYAAMRNNIVELMANPLTPLFKTLGLGAVNASMNRMMARFLGHSDILPADPIIAVNEYAYYNGSVKFGPMLKIILDVRGIMKRMFTGAVERWTEEARPHYIAIVESWHNRDWRQLSEVEILSAVCQLTEAAIDAYGALVSGVIPAAWMSEGLFTLIYKLVKRRKDPTAASYLLGFNSIPLRGEKQLYDLSRWAENIEELADYLQNTPASAIAVKLERSEVPGQVSEPVWQEWTSRFQTYLNDYGHMIYNLDFANPVPADDPVPVIETFQVFLRGQGVNPHERQQAAAQKRQDITQAMTSRLSGLRLKVFRKNLARAQRYAPLREDGLAEVGLSYPLVRQMLFEIGRRFVEHGVVEKAEDIFWLEQEEVKHEAGRLARGEAVEPYTACILQRKAVWRAARRVSPPMMLPQMKLFGIDLVQLKQGKKQGKGKTIKGVAASPGMVTAPARVIHGPEDFATMNTGDVLVAPMTTPAWTPLFVRAAAVVTDVGGPLSHGSIVAREYGIPAVLGTGVATRLIENGQIVTVDGSAGTVILGSGS